MKKEMTKKTSQVFRVSRNNYISGMLNSVLKNNKDRKSIKEIIKAMSKIDRNFFVSAKDPYIDAPLSIGYGQTISQPTTVARMLCLLDLKEHMDILEIGSGSGWNAALIAFLVSPGKVISVERIKELHDMSKKNYSSIQEKLGLYNTEFVFADALDKTQKFWKIKYDRIIAAAAASEEFTEELKDMALYLLNNEGLILFPTEAGTLELWQFKDKKLRKIYSEYGYSFVPLVKGTRQF